MERIDPRLMPLVERASKKDEKMAFHLERLQHTCHRYNLTLEYHSNETMSQYVDEVADLYRNCYPDRTVAQARSYIEKCFSYSGYGAFALFQDSRIVAMRWWDDGSPRDYNAQRILYQHHSRTGSNLLIWGVHRLVRPAYHDLGLSTDIDMLFVDFCNTVYQAPPVIVSRILPTNQASEKVAINCGFTFTGLYTSNYEKKLWSWPHYWFEEEED